MKNNEIFPVKNTIVLKGYCSFYLEVPRIFVYYLYYYFFYDKNARR